MKTKKARSFRTKLWLFFTLFAAFILLVLWLLQTVFLQQFYDLMIVRNTRKIAKQVVESLNKGEDVDLDKIALENSLAIYICTEYGTPMYMADEHSSKKSLRVPVRREDGNIDFIPADEAGDDYQWPAGVTVNYYYPLDGKAEKIRDALMESKTGQAEIKAKGYYAYGSKFKAYPLDPNSKLEDNILVLANINICSKQDFSFFFYHHGLHCSFVIIVPALNGWSCSPITSFITSSTWSPVQWLV